MFEVLLAFLKLGLTSFGGPVAHLGYFRTEFVQRRKWLDDEDYSDLVALSQFLPGPASSKVGIALGMRRAGVWGALAAWLGFTLPSAVVLILFALGVAQWQGLAQSGVLHGLKVAAVAIVAQAVWGMARSLCPDRLRAAMAIAAALAVLAVPGTAAQVAAIAFSGLLGWHLIDAGSPAAVRSSGFALSRRAGIALLTAFAVLLFLLPALAVMTQSFAMSAAAAFYRAGALVFGGGHVVLPLLQASVVPNGWVAEDLFLAGYGAAQAVPGPLFTFAAYLGAVMSPPLGGWMGGFFLLVMVFVPGALLVLGALPFWDRLRRHDGMRRAMAGANASVVGVLAAALYDPVWTSAIHTRGDFGLALLCFGLLLIGRCSPVLVVGLAAAGGWWLAAG